MIDAKDLKDDKLSLTQMAERTEKFADTYYQTNCKEAIKVISSVLREKNTIKKCKGYSDGWTLSDCEEGIRLVIDVLKEEETIERCKKYSHGWTVQTCKEAIKAIAEMMREALLERKSFKIAKFATFETYVGDKDSTRIGRNPKNPEQVTTIQKRVRPRIVWSREYKKQFKQG